MNTQLSILRKALTVAVLLTILVATSGNAFVAHANGPVVTTPPCRLGSDIQDPPTSTVVPPGQSDDADWPIIEQWIETKTDATGATVSTTYTLRRNPKTPSDAVMAPTVSCNYQADESLTSTNTIQGVTQYLKSFFYRYNWVNGSTTYKAYWIYKTEEWWTRTSTSYTVGQNSTVWTYNGWNCSNSYSTDSATGGFTPNWYNNTETYHYIYDFTRNGSSRHPAHLLAWATLTLTKKRPPIITATLLAHL